MNSQRELNLKFTTLAPDKPGRYMVYFPGTHTFDVVNVVNRRGIVSGEFYLSAVGRGGNIDNWNCVWSELPNSI